MQMLLAEMKKRKSDSLVLSLPLLPVFLRCNTERTHRTRTLFFLSSVPFDKLQKPIGHWLKQCWAVPPGIPVLVVITGGYLWLRSRHENRNISVQAPTFQRSSIRVSIRQLGFSASGFSFAFLSTAPMPPNVMKGR